MKMRRLACVAVLVCCLAGCARGICVLDNKKGWSLECGLRDSYLFRVKDYGGIRANFDFGFEFGNEKGFPLSITNVKREGQGYHRRMDDTARSDNVGLGSPASGKRQGPNSRAWPLPYNLQPPPLSQGSLEKGAPIIQVPAQRRHQISAERTPFQPSSESRAAVVQAASEREVPVVRPGPERGNPVYTPNIRPSVESRIVPKYSLETGSPQPSVGGGVYDRRTSNDRPVQNPRSRFLPQKSRRRNQNYRQPTTMETILSWLQWPFTYFFSSSEPDPVPAPPRAISSPGHNERSSSNFQVFHEGDAQGVVRPLHNQPHLSSSQSKPAFLFPPPVSIHTTPPTRPVRPPPTIGPEIGQVLRVNWDTPADTDHVPSFAAKTFVVREAPKDFHPPDYTSQPSEQSGNRVEVPRTTFFCEEQKYLPGIYADTQLGCKVFHLCVPAAMGNSLTSFLCPNMTLFDQSVLQCNWWYHVRCEDSNKHFDANLPMAISYRKINAAQLPLSAVNNLNSVSLLAHNTNGFVSRISRALDVENLNTDLELQKNEEENASEEESSLNQSSDKSENKSSLVGSDLSHDLDLNNGEEKELTVDTTEEKKIAQNSDDFDSQNSSNEAESLTASQEKFLKSHSFQDISAMLKRFYILLEVAQKE